MNKKFKKLLMVLLVVVIIFVGFMYEVYISYNKLIVKDYSIRSNQISNSINLVISDLHDNQLGENNKKLVDKINYLYPDFILVVGDVVNADSKNSQVVTHIMKQLCKNYKVFYSLGNSDIDYISAGTSDLVVSGHTHGGQVVLPFVGGLYVGDQGWFPKYDKGLFDLNDTKTLITSGLGASNEILTKFNNTPEVVYLKLNAILLCNINN